MTELGNKYLSRNWTFCNREIMKREHRRRHDAVYFFSKMNYTRREEKESERKKILSKHIELFHYMNILTAIENWILFLAQRGLIQFAWIIILHSQKIWMDAEGFFFMKRIKNKNRLLIFAVDMFLNNNGETDEYRGEKRTNSVRISKEIRCNSRRSERY